MLLILVNAYSKWVEVCAVKSTTSDVVMRCPRSVFARFGLPNTLVSDNGLCFVSAEFEVFLERNGIRHVTASPYHPASNVLAERAVQTVKNGLKKIQPGPITDRLAHLLFSYRTTPHTTTGTTPAELLLGRQLQTRFHKLYPDRQGAVEKHQTRQKIIITAEPGPAQFRLEMLCLSETLMAELTSGSWLGGEADRACLLSSSPSRPEYGMDTLTTFGLIPQRGVPHQLSQSYLPIVRMAAEWKQLAVNPPSHRCQMTPSLLHPCQQKHQHQWTQTL